MKKSKAIKWLALFTLTAMLLTSCAAVKDYQDVMSQDLEIPEALSTISVADAKAGVKLYAQNDNFSLYVDEQNATFTVVDKDGNRWSSAPQLTAGDENTAPEYADATSMSLVRINYCNQLNVLDERSCYDDCVKIGKAKVMKLANGVRFEFNFEKYGIVIPVQVLLREDGVDMTKNYQDCGMLLFDIEGQDMHAGASGCGCAASVLCGYLLKGMEERKWKKILFAPTGALLSPVSGFQGESIPGISHAVTIERI